MKKENSAGLEQRTKTARWALHVLRQQNEYEIAGLMTTFNAAFDRVAMHSTRRALVENAG